MTTLRPIPTCYPERGVATDGADLRLRIRRVAVVRSNVRLPHLTPHHPQEKQGSRRQQHPVWRRIIVRRVTNQQSITGTMWWRGRESPLGPCSSGVAGSFLAQRTESSGCSTIRGFSSGGCGVTVTRNIHKLLLWKCKDEFIINLCG